MTTRRTPSAVLACRWLEPRSIASAMGALYHRGRGGCHGPAHGANRDAMAKAIPEGHHSVTPHLTVRGAARAIDFYRRAFGAEEVMRMPSRDGTKLMHAHLRIGDSAILLNDEFPEMGGRSPEALGGTPTTIHLYVPDADQVFARAVAAGAQVRMPLQDMFWGDRYGQIVDPFGHVWAIATHKEDLTPEEIARRAAASARAPHVRISAVRTPRGARSRRPWLPRGPWSGGGPCRRSRGSCRGSASGRPGCPRHEAARHTPRPRRAADRTRR